MMNEFGRKIAYFILITSSSAYLSSSVLKKKTGMPHPNLKNKAIQKEKPSSFWF